MFIHGPIIKRMLDLFDEKEVVTIAQEAGKDIFQKIIASNVAPNNLIF